ncbi:MAG: hypothetical protein ACMVP2_21605 [Imperialibacter sp.]|uniref:hypothetical protein n=1 Tax=Imperialibacter sp. TaxID=2038411 RepID=UPI0030D8FD6D|tara:strand:- start:1290 stop:1574 length:285 start_codon:yes stop_codon:yes gene_type:complete
MKAKDMKQNNEVTILNEVYLPENAEEVISGLIDQKINFLKLKNLSSHVIYFKPNQHCQSEIERLDALKMVLIGKVRTLKSQPLRLKLVSYFDHD